MKELSLHILDIAQNSIRAKAKNITIQIDEKIRKNSLHIIIKDDGKGIDKYLLEHIKDPFVTTRKTRKIGLGIPLLNHTCLLCNGKLNIISEINKGTTIEAYMDYDNIDRPPMGNIASTIVGLIASNIDVHFLYKHSVNEKEFVLDTIEINKILDGVLISNPEVYEWLKKYIIDNINSLKNK